MPDTPVFSVNGTPLPCTPSLTIAAVLQARGDAPDAVATALNGDFIARTAREHTPVEPGDALTIFSAIVGG